MPTARQVSVTKKQRISNDNEDNDERTIATIRTEECVSFEALADKEYPTELIAENLLRMLNYDALNGLGELLSLVVRSAGCQAEFNITSDSIGNDSEANTIVETIESSCVSSEHGFPSTFPFQRVEFSKKVAQVIGAVVSVMHDTGDESVLEYAIQLIVKMTTLSLQSLRIVASGIAGMMLNALDEENTNLNVLITALVSRLADVSPAIRRRAVADLAQYRPLEVIRSLNDVHSSVRLSALRSLRYSSNEFTAADDHDENGETATSSLRERVEQIAVQDIELSVRRAALRFLNTNDHLINDSGMFVSMLQDSDEQSRKLAAELVVRKESKETTSAALLLVKLCKLAKNNSMVSSLAFGLDKVKGKYRVQWGEEIAVVLSSDYEKNSRKPKLASSLKQQYKVLAKELDDERTRLNLISMLETVLETQSHEITASILPHVIPLIRKGVSRDAVLFKTLKAVSKLPFDTFMARSETTKLSVHVFDLVRDLFMERGHSLKTFEGISHMLSAMPEVYRTRVLKDVYQDLRIRLASLLGPHGKSTKGNEVQLKIVVLQLIIVGRFFNISDLIKLPIWHAVSTGNKPLLQLVRAIGMKGDSDTIKIVIDQLNRRKCGPAVDDILRIFVSAKMREINLELALPIDVNETEPTSEPTWRAAVASGVI